MRQAALPQKLSAFFAAQANLLQNHVRALDAKEEAGRLERDAYERLVKDQRALALNLAALATAMRSYRDLPMAKHDMAPLTDQASRETLSAFVDAERELARYLEEQVQEFQTMLRDMKA
jgi:hypothetical protein